MYFAPNTPDENPPHGGSWLRDPISGALTLIVPEPDPVPSPPTPEPTPEE
jgi:hypothetical protein